MSFQLRDFPSSALSRAKIQGVAHTRRQGETAGPFTLENWRFLWAPETVEALANKPPVIPLTINTLVFSLATAGVVLLISSMAGYALSRLFFPGRRIFLGSVLLLHSFPSVTLLIATFMVIRQLGLYDTLIGVIPPDPPASPPTATRSR